MIYEMDSDVWEKFACAMDKKFDRVLSPSEVDNILTSTFGLQCTAGTGPLDYIILDEQKLTEFILKYG